MRSNSLLLVFSSLALSAPPSAQTASCNDLNRSVAIPAGVSGAVVTTPCAQLTVSVAGSSFSTPPACIVGYTRYMETVYSCGPVLEHINCDPQGYKATIKNYENGGCPDFSGLADGMSWESWDDVPENLVSIIRNLSSCVAPEADETFDYSASTTACKIQVDPPEETLLSGTDDCGRPYLQWQEDPRGYGWGTEPSNFLQDAYGAAMNGAGGTSNSLLAQVESAFPPLPGISFVATVNVEHFRQGGGAPDHVSTFRYAGRLAANGTFDLIQDSVAIKEGVREPRRHRQLFDGMTLVFATEGTLEGTAYTGDYLTDQPFLSMEVLPYLKPLYWWLDNPFQISRFPSHSYAAESSGDFVTLKKTYIDGAGSYVDRTYLVDSSSTRSPRVLSTAILDPGGGVREEATFSDFREVDTGCWRPFRFEHTVHLEGDPEGRRVRWRYRMESAKPLPSEEIAEIPVADLPSGRVWTIWH